MSLRPACHVLLVVLLAAAPALPGHAAPSAPLALPTGCDTFSWDVSRELAALSGTPEPVSAGAGGVDGGPRIALETLYQVRLLPQAEVTLAARPGKPMLDDDARAGLLMFQVPADGRYRVSITTGHWIDVVDDGRIIASLDFQGRRGCALVHKIVEFQLPAGRDLVLQFAGGAAEASGVVITAVANPPE